MFSRCKHVLTNGYCFKCDKPAGEQARAEYLFETGLQDWVDDTSVKVTLVAGAGAPIFARTPRLATAADRAC